jgi:hypothetical protein
MRTLTIISVMVLLAFSKAVFACSCGSTENINFEKFAKYIVIGKVESKNLSFSLSQNKYEFSIIETLYGDQADTITIWSHKHSETCGYPYKNGVEYLVAVSEVDGQYESGQCSSWPVSSEMAIKLLNKLRTEP